MPPNILVVDDDADMRQMLLCALQPLGDVREAADGPAALRLLRKRRPKLMLLDVAMPEMNGLEVLLAARELAPGMIVVMLTGESDLAVAKRALELGARTYITKPFDMNVVTAEIQRLLEDESKTIGAAPYRPWRIVR